MKRIIVPVDFSEYSEKALQTAAFLAKKTSAELMVVHMLELSSAVINQSENYMQQEMVFYLKLSEKKFATFLDKEYLADIKVTPIIKHFKIFSEIDELAKEEKADLIVMGSKGVDGLKEMFIGSNTEKVIRHSKTPVMVIKNQAITQSFTKAIFACDFTDDDVAPYLEAKTFFENLNCDLDLVYVNTPTAKFTNSAALLEKMTNFFNHTNESADRIKEVQVVSDFSVEEGVFYHADKTNASILVVATHGRKGVSHFFGGSISEDIANHSKLPVLSFKI